MSRHVSPGSEPWSWIDLANALLRHRRPAAIVGLITFVLAAIVIVTRPDRYTATASFMPQAPQSGGQLASMAAQLGVPLAVGDQTRSPAFYADLLRTRSILTPVARMPVKTAGGARVQLSALLDIEADDEARRQVRTRSRLNENLGVTTSLETGVVTFAVTMPDPVAAADVAAALLREVQRFDVETRQSQASAQRDFAASRLQELEAELRTLERALEEFLASNRDFMNSPTLRFTHERLERQTLQARQNVMAISQAHEQARMDAVRDMPVITVIEPPEVPAKANPKNTIPLLVLSLVLAGLVALAFAVVLDRVTADHRDPGRAEFRRLRAEAIADLRRLGIRRPGQVAGGRGGDGTESSRDAL